MTTSSRSAFASTLIVSLLGCQSMATGADAPALITDPDEKSVASLAAALSIATGTEHVVVADNALTETSVLALEHGPREQIGGMPAQGRVLDKPLRFHLLKNGDDCILVDDRNGKRFELDNTTCRPETRR